MIKLLNDNDRLSFLLNKNIWYRWGVPRLYGNCCRTGSVSRGGKGVGGSSVRFDVGHFANFSGLGFAGRR